MASSATLSPDDTMSAPSGPRTATTPFGQLSFVALTRASTASSGVLNDCCALATDTDARMTIAAIQAANLPNDEGIWVMTISPPIQLRVDYPGSGRNSRARGNPVVVSFEFYAELVVVDAQVSIATTYDSVWHDSLHLLRHDADVGLVAAVIAEAIKAETVV